jgi:hypothetical protein
MTSEQAARVVFVSGMLEAGYVLIRGSKGITDGKTYKSLWAIGLLTLGLAVFADFIPQVAGPFAVLVLVAMIIRNRGELGSVITPGSPASSKPARGYRSSTPKATAGRPAGTIGHQ